MENYNIDNYEESIEEGIGKHYIVPILIIIVGIFISGIIFSIRINIDKQKNFSQLEQSQLAFTPGAPENIQPVSAEDHILGNPNAIIKIVEFSDFECPFCKVFHNVMNKVVDTYGRDGKVAWIYRHLPLDSIHTKARKEAIAAECANEIGGNTAFWKYADRIFEITPSNDNLDLSLLPEIAEYSGVGGQNFIDCLESGRYDKHIEDNFSDAINSGANGTPYTIVIAPNGKTFPITGSQTYATISSLIELVAKEKNN